MVTKGLRTWFVIHFIADVIFAIPLIITPLPFVSLFGLYVVNPLFPRLVGAALMGIGVESYLGRNAGVEAYRGMLNLKIIWSGTAALGILLTMLTIARPLGTWLLLVVFVLFNLLWVYYRLQLRES